MSQQQALPLSYPGPRTGEKFFDHQKAGLSKMLFMENDYRSLYEAMVRHDPSLKDLQYLDLSSFPHSWRHEGGDEWSQDFSDTLGHEEIRPLQGKGMILADEWAKNQGGDPLEPTYRLPKEYKLSEIYIDEPPAQNQPRPGCIPRFWSNADEMQNEPSSTSSADIVRSSATLIICPKTVLEVWKSLIKTHWKGQKAWGEYEDGGQDRPENRPLVIYNHYDNQTSCNVHPYISSSIVLTSYEALRPGARKSNIVNNIHFYRVILDEGQ
ncbi:uncharacterized protein I303_105410 [Kwoniella dejecticola CBS 10117]|uniref:SNF2 N-terminal domain-containing protein n=1 Tax=Kwoniella dejecticola CBS 10117 TaxID=1296121 RepID=A0AAJ8MJ01_9TREE